MYSERITSLPSPFGSAKSGALSPSFNVVDFPPVVAGGILGGASGDWPDLGDCPNVAIADPIKKRVTRSAFIVV